MPKKVHWKEIKILQTMIEALRIRMSGIISVYCEQTLFFLRFCEESSRAWSFSCLARFARPTKNKERLLVV